MKFLTNLYDPDQPDAKGKIRRLGDETREQAWANQKRWLTDKVIGLPEATADYSVSALLHMGMVGVYSES